MVDYNGYEVTDYIDLKKFGRIYKYGYNSLLSVFMYCFYDENFNFLQYCPRYVPEEFTDINGHPKSVEYVLLEGARYIRLVNEMVRTNFIYTAVPRNINYIVDDTIFDKSSRFLFHGDESIVNLGDSIFGNNDSVLGVSNLIAMYANTTVYNCAFGGTRMAIRGTTTTGYDKFDFSNLVDAIVSGDYTLQEEALTLYDLPSYFSSRLENLKSVDFNKVNIVTLNYGSNDYTGGVGLSKFKEKGIEAISKLQKKFPHLNVVLITPAWRCWLDSDGLFLEDGNTKKYADFTLADYVEADKELAKELNIPIIDVYNIGINKNNWSYFFAPADTTHHDILGRDRLARVISRALTNIA
jgi:lysophospholipase L1-like esterase